MGLLSAKLQFTDGFVNLLALSFVVEGSSENDERYAVTVLFSNYVLSTRTCTCKPVYDKQYIFHVKY